MFRRLTPRSTQLTRRKMLRNTTLAGIGVWTAAAGSSGGQSRLPNEKLSIAGVGVAGQGGWDIGNCASENVVALCDVDDRRTGPAVKKFPKAKMFRDFRKMLDAMGEQIDAAVWAISVSNLKHGEVVSDSGCFRFQGSSPCSFHRGHRIFFWDIV